MREQVIKVVRFVVILSFIFGIFWGIKHQNWVTIAQLDLAMDPDYPAGNYHIGPMPSSQAELIIGRALAYVVPGSAERERRVAWLVAREGQKVEVKDKTVFVDGVKSECKIYVQWDQFAPFIVPRGTVYLVSINPEKDSFTFGPIPFRNIMGQL